MAWGKGGLTNAHNLPYVKSYALAELMGHASTDTTMGYVRLAGGRGAEVIAAMFGTDPDAA
jgi:hypothetical protein